MINVLAVDDSVYSIEGIKCAVDWKSIGVSQLFTAFNAEQAKTVLRSERVDIVITDIEMPHGNGFDLLRWMREQGYDPVVIILTSYGVFQYARQAVEFRCIDYLLKPVSPAELLAAVQKGIGMCMERMRANEDSHLARLWNNDEERRLRSFWREVLEDYGETDTEGIIKIARRANVEISPDAAYVPLLFVMHKNGMNNETSDLAVKFAQRLRHHTFEDKNAVVNRRPPYVWAVISLDREKNGDGRQELSKRCKDMLAWAREELETESSCYLGNECEVGGVAAQIRRFENAAENGATDKAMIYLDDIRSEKIYVRPPLDRWLSMVCTGEHETALQMMGEYLNKLSGCGGINRNCLCCLFRDFKQELYERFGEYEAKSSIIFSDPHSEKLHGDACESIQDMQKWMSYVCRKAAEYSCGTTDDGSLVAGIKRYVKENLAEELNRSVLAKRFYLSADYISRVFKKETGVQLTEYITEKRMEEARRLLESSDMSVGEVAERCGYYNMAYFSKTFRIRNGITPMQYREKNPSK